MICIAGKNDIAVNVLRFVVQYYGSKNILAIANKDDSGQHSWQASLKATAIQLNVRLISLDEAYSIPELHFFSVEFDRIVVPIRFKQAELYNIHFSLLPKYKGVYTAVWPLLNGEIETGVTLHRMVEGIDTGPIIHQSAISIAPSDTARDVYHACLILGYEVLREFIPRLVKEPIVGIAQSVANSTYYGPKSINFSNIIIDLRQTAYQLHNMIRAFSFQEYQLPIVLGRRVSSSKPILSPSLVKPGTLLDEDDIGFTISTIDFDLYLVKDYSLELIQCIEDNKLVRIQEIVGKLPNLEIRTRQGWSPLMMAAYANNIYAVKLLVESGADINATNKKGTSVLMYAKSALGPSHDLELIRYLVDHGANYAAIDITGKSVLDYARIEGNKEVIKYFESLLR